MINDLDHHRIQFEFQELFNKMVKKEKSEIESVDEIQLNAIALNVYEHICERIICQLDDIKDKILNEAYKIHISREKNEPVKNTFAI